METALFSFAPAVALVLIHQQNAQWPSAAQIALRVPQYGFTLSLWPKEWWRLFTCMFIHESDTHLFDNVCDVTATYCFVFVVDRPLNAATMFRDAAVGVAGGLVAGLGSYHLHQRFGVVDEVLLESSDVAATATTGVLNTVITCAVAAFRRLSDALSLSSPPATFYCGAEPIVGVIRGFHLGLRPQVNLAIPVVGRIAADVAHYVWWRVFGAAGGTDQIKTVGFFLKNVSWFRRWNTDLFGQHCGVVVGLAIGLSWRALARMRMMRRRRAAGFVGEPRPARFRGFNIPVPPPLVLPNALQEANPQCPPEFYCPLSRCLMLDPVVTADGQTYDRPSIEQWFRLGHTTSPVTNLELPFVDVIPNFALRQIMTEWQ